MESNTYTASAPTSSPTSAFEGGSAGGDETSAADLAYMREALAEAAAAVQAGNHPFGAVLVVDGKVHCRCFL